MSEWPEEEKEERGEKEEPILWEEGREEEALGLILSALVTLSSNILDLSKRNIKILPGKDSFPICPQLEVTKNHINLHFSFLLHTRTHTHSIFI